MKSNAIEMQNQRHEMAADINSKTPMNIVLRCHGLKARAFWQGLVEAQLKRLQDLVAIASARVTLEWQHEVKPAFRVLAHLEVPGPDFHAEASDYTLQAAWLKVVKNLERQIRVRKGRQADKRKANLRLGLLSERSSLTLAGGRA
jgi:ribosome-associated translation inhibitor RaiA